MPAAKFRCYFFIQTKSTKAMKKIPFLKETYLVFAAVVLLSTLTLPFTMVSQKPIYQSSLKPFSNDDDDDEDKTLSPYFYVKCDNPDVDQLPLKETTADVTIAGVIADVKVTQVYMNTGKKTLEAIYVFPASTRAAVYDMRMTVGDRLLVAKIQEKATARKQYEEAKSEGKTASLLEQDRPNVFQMNVANILPGDTIKVEMHYTELLVPEDGVYEFVYPTVVGPRYSNKDEATASTDDKWVSNPYTKEGVAPTYSFDMKAKINAGMKIKAISCTSHKVSVNYESTNSAIITLNKSQADEGNRDFILQYKLADNAIETGMLLFKGENEDENFFLTMIQPPESPEIDNVPPRDFVFIMDVSGSMNGYPIETEKTLLKNLISNLRPVDKFNVVLFAGGASALSTKSISATDSNLKEALAFIDKPDGSGGTELLPALQKAMKLDKTEGFSRTFVISTDGYVDVEKEAFDLISDNLNKSNFFAFGVGTAVNRFLIEGIADVGMGEKFIVTKEADCSKKAEKFRKYIQTPVLTDITTNYGDFNVYDVVPLNVPDVLAERPILIYGKWKGDPTGTITIKGKTGKEDFSWSYDMSQAKSSSENKALRYLWARQKIKILDDYNNAGTDSTLIEEITALGLKYNLLSNYTSFIAIDSLIRNKTGKSTTVKQPLPMPEGVSNLAVSGIRSMQCCSVMQCVVESNMEVESSYDMMPAFINVESMPQFTGGETALQKFLLDNLVYPEAAIKSNVSGTVYLQFIVDSNGNISNIKILKGIGGGCDEEAIRVAKLMSKMWTPGKQNGTSVSVSMIIPIKFTLK
jgi:Ca-activated chloride channel family protein